MTLKTKQTLSLLAVLAVAAMIFCFSAQQGEDSSELSGTMTEFVLTLAVPGFRQLSPAQQAPYFETWGFAVRKLAHFSEFALLAVTLVIHLYYARPSLSWRGLLLAAWVLATLYAGTDEFHQMFVDGRGPSPVDVMIDSAGALTGAVLSAVTIALRSKRTRDPSSRPSSAERP